MAKKTQRQVSSSVRPPPTNGPSAEPERRHAVGEPERAAAPVLRVRVREHRDGQREHQRPGRALDDPEGDHDVGRRSESARDRGDGEQREAGEQRPAPPEDVADTPAEDEQRREREHVAADHPLEIRGRDVEVLGHPRECEVEREVVELDDEHRQRRGRQHAAEPALVRASSTPLHPDGSSPTGAPAAGCAHRAGALTECEA